VKPILVLDSTPLGLLFQRPGIVPADECRAWLKQRLLDGVRIIVPEIIHYELRRELLRLGHAVSEAALSQFGRAVPDRYLPITTSAMDLAAELWARARKQGKPTANPHALDIDVILSAQMLAGGFDPSEFIVATSNVSHISLFVPAAPWETL
jgi:predicted nucleic acid-binding protein